MNEKDFCDKIKVLRKQNNMTQDDLASKLNVTRQAISNWERGLTIPDINMIEKISSIFSLGIDEIISGETKKIEKQYDRSGTKLLYITSVLLVLANIIVSYFFHNEIKTSTIFPVSIIVYIQTIIFFTFSNAMKNNNYSMIAGFDRRIRYNSITLKKILYSIENHTMISSIIFICIFITLGYIEVPEKIGGIIILLYMVEFIFSIMFINIKNQENLFEDNKDLLVAKIGNRINIVFIGFIFLSVVTLIYTMEIYNIENNSIESLKMIGIMSPYIILCLVSLFSEQKRCKENAKKDEIYNPSKMTYISMVICIILLVAMVLVAGRV